MSDVPDDDADFPANPAAEHDEVVSELMRLLVERDAIRFGKFPLKGGKSTSYWLDIGALYEGHDQFTIGRALASTIKHAFGETIDVIFSSSQDATPVAMMATQYYALLTGMITSIGFYHPLDVVGTEPVQTFGGRLGENRQVVIVEDVLTSGDAIRAAVCAVRSTGATVVGICTLFDRREREKGVLCSAVLAKETGLKVVTCATVMEIGKKLPEEVFTAEQRSDLAKAR